MCVFYRNSYNHSDSLCCFDSRWVSQWIPVSNIFHSILLKLTMNTSKQYISFNFFFGVNLGHIHKFCNASGILNFDENECNDKHYSMILLHFISTVASFALAIHYTTGCCCPSDLFSSITLSHLALLSKVCFHQGLKEKNMSAKIKLAVQVR